MNKLDTFAAVTALFLGAALPAPALADTIALDSTRGTGNQSWVEALGMDFNVLSAITVTQLGAFDSAQDGFAGTIQVGIFKTDGTQVGSTATLTGTGNALVGQQRFADVVDFNLGPGSYSIVAVGFGGSDPNGNIFFSGAGPTINTGGGLITFVGNARYNNSGNFSLAFPSLIDGGPPNNYDAGTFQFTAVVPEPEAYGLALAGLVVLGVGLNRRHLTARASRA